MASSKVYLKRDPNGKGRGEGWYYHIGHGQFNKEKDKTGFLAGFKDRPFYGFPKIYSSKKEFQKIQNRFGVSRTDTVLRPATTKNLRAHLRWNTKTNYDPAHEKAIRDATLKVIAAKNKRIVANHELANDLSMGWYGKPFNSLSSSEKKKITTHPRYL